ncbi:hypothetical protein [Ferruginibacter sp.]|nr:hypothetical protein [Ferruginibacter sp.]
MDTLKMKFKLHGLEFELEGNETTVKQEFENFKIFTVDLLSKVNVISPQATITPQIPSTLQGQQFKHLGQPEEATFIDVADIPTLKDVKLRDLAKSETDWLLVYAYYASAGGTKEYTRDNIIQLYKDTDRRTDNRIKSLSQLFKNISKALYIKSTNDTNFILLEKGKNKVLEIFKGNSSAKTAKKTIVKSKLSENKMTDEDKIKETKAKKGKPKTTNSIGFVDLKLTPAEQKSLNDFFEVKQPKTQNEKVITAMKWFIDDKKIDEVAMEEMNYLLSIAAETPPALAQVLGNMVGAGFRWVTKGEIGKYKLSSIGENYVVNKLPKKSK